MSEQNKIQLFENQPIRTAWNEEQEEWYFSVVDVIHVLTGSENPRRYWSDLKRKLKSEGATQLYENIVQLKMKSSDGKNYKTDAATTEQLLRIIQSIPSPRAEPVKRWLAEVGRERIEETIDPEQAIDRALETYLKKGYDPDWVHQRLLSIRIRNELTDEWQKRGVEKGHEFAILTDEITRTWSGMTTRQYKNLKGLKKENLRDNMSDTELVLTMLAEASTRDISKASKPEGFFGSMEVARQGGEVAGVARKALEERTGAPVSKNLVDYQIPELPYGVLSTTQTGVMEKLRLPGLQQTVGGSASGIYGVDSGVGIPAVTPVIPSYQEPAYTSAKDMERKDGSIGTLKIPSLDINMKVWEGETNESMKKGLGHYSSTSAWDGNIGVCGHNRGAKYTIGSIKDLEIGDTITYTTIYGTRTYEVVLVKTISNSDWSYLQATADNRITLTTCLANQPEKRICVQAVQITQ